jgi:hypothetical protein
VRNIFTNSLVVIRGIFGTIRFVESNTEPVTQDSASSISTGDAGSPFEGPGAEEKTVTWYSDRDRPKGGLFV